MVLLQFGLESNLTPPDVSHLMHYMVFTPSDLAKIEYLKVMLNLLLDSNLRKVVLQV